MRLNQVIAVEKGIKSKVNADIDTISKASQKRELFDGFIKKYRAAKDDDPEEVPSQAQNLQIRANDALGMIAQRWTELLDVTAQKDFANCVARTDLTVDGITIVKDAPVTYLLFLEKQVVDLQTIVSKFPVLDPAEQWLPDPATGVYKTEPQLTTRTKKVQRPIVLYDATPEHPAQAQLITEDVGVGTWELTKFSGALPDPLKRALLMRISQLLVAVKTAREQANIVDAPKVSVGEALFAWVFGTTKESTAKP